MVADAACVMASAAAYDAGDPYARRAPHPFAVEHPPVGLRVGVPPGELQFFGDGEAERLYRASVDRIAASGAEIVDIDLAPFRKVAGLLYQGPWVAERLSEIRAFATQNPDALHDVVGQIILGADKLSAVDAFEGFYALAAFPRRLH